MPSKEQAAVQVGVALFFSFFFLHLLGLKRKEYNKQELKPKFNCAPRWTADCKADVCTQNEKSKRRKKKGKIKYYSCFLQPCHWLVIATVVHCCALLTDTDDNIKN